MVTSAAAAADNDAALVGCVRICPRVVLSASSIASVLGKLHGLNSAEDRIPSSIATTRSRNSASAREGWRNDRAATFNNTPLSNYENSSA